jgi:hypothetical protein
VVSESQERWSELGRRLGEVGRAVRGHFEDEPGPDAVRTRWDAPPDAAAGGAGPGAADGAGPGPAGGPGGRTDPAGDRAAIQDAVRQLGDTARRLGGQAAEAARDPAVRGSVQEAARMLGAAVAATADELGVQLRQRLRDSPAAADRSPWEQASEPPPPSEAPFSPPDSRSDRPADGEPGDAAPLPDRTPPDA